jgi:hypothetical protein
MSDGDEDGTRARDDHDHDRSSFGGHPPRADVLGFPVQLGGGVGGAGRRAVRADKERRLGVPLIPDRAAARSFERGDTTPAAPRDRRVTGAAALAVSILVGATIAGIAPLPAAATLALLVPAAVIDVE